MGLFGKSTPEEKAARRAARLEREERTLTMSLTRTAELNDGILIITEGLTDTRLPVSRIESITTRLHTVTIHTTQRDYELKAAVPTLMSLRHFNTWVETLRQAVETP